MPIDFRNLGGGGSAIPSVADAVLYVSTEGSDGNNGTSWGKSFKTLAAAILAAPTTGCKIYIAGGTYLVTTTISMLNRYGIEVIGTGNPGQYSTATQFVWTGSTGGLTLDMSGTIRCSVRKIGFYANLAAAGSDTTQTAIRAWGNGNAGVTSCFKGLVEDCYFQNYGKGIELGNGIGDQVDTWTINRCWSLAGVSGVGVRNNSVNALVNVIRDCSFGGNGTPTTSKGVWITSGSVSLENPLTTSNRWGIYIDGTVFTSRITSHHSESDGTAIATTLMGTHQKAGILLIEDSFVYAPTVTMFEFLNSDITYIVQGASGFGSVNALMSILVPDVPQEVFLYNVTFPGLVADPTNSAVRRVPGWYGPQTVANRPHKLANVDVQSPNTVDTPFKVTANGATANLAEYWYGGALQAYISPDGGFMVLSAPGQYVAIGNVGPAGQSGLSFLGTPLYADAANRLRTSGKLTAGLGIGVGNSAAATTPGSVVKKMEVFDAAGASLGFVPIYSSIT